MELGKAMRCGLALGTILYCVIADAGIIATTGAAFVISPPASVQPGLLESNTSAFVFTETTNAILPANTNVDVSLPGVYTNPTPPLTPGTLLAGTRVDSYLFHTDPVGTTQQGIPFQGSITFGSDVLGIELFFTTIGPTNFLGAANTSYPAFPDGLEDGDQIILTNDRRTVTFNTHSGAGQDNMRIFTAVPEPATLALVGLGLAGLGFSRRKQ